MTLELRLFFFFFNDTATTEIYTLSRPDARLPIQTVRERTFRGMCLASEELTALFARFNAQKDAIYALYHSLEPEGLEPKRVKQALDYYDEFYKVIGDPGATRREFMRSC